MLHNTNCGKNSFQMCCLYDILALSSMETSMCLLQGTDLSPAGVAQLCPCHIKIKRHYLPRSYYVEKKSAFKLVSWLLLYHMEWWCWTVFDNTNHAGDWICLKPPRLMELDSTKGPHLLLLDAVLVRCAVSWPLLNWIIHYRDWDLLWWTSVSFNALFFLPFLWNVTDLLVDMIKILCNRYDIYLFFDSL